jgi:hypothetical protein
MTIEEHASDGEVTGRPVDLQRIPIMAQLLFTFRAELANGRRLAFGPSQLAALVQVPTRRVLQVLNESLTGLLPLPAVRSLTASSRYTDVLFTASSIRFGGSLVSLAHATETSCRSFRHYPGMPI